VVLTGGNRVRVVAARTGTFYGRKMTGGHIYTVAGNGSGFSGDGGLPLRAEITDPVGVSVDAAGDIAVTGTSAFVAGEGELFDVSVDTTVDLIAARSGTFFGRPLTAGRLYNVAGNGIEGFRGDKGPARNAEFCINGPNVYGVPGVPTNGASLAFGGSGNLVVADGCNNRVRLIAVRSGGFFGQTMKAGDVYTIAGTSAAGFSGDGRPAVTEKLNDPTGAGVDHHGNVLIADTLNNRVRVIAAATGTFYGQKMTGGHIYTIAGASAAGFSGDGGPAVKAKLAGPAGVAADQHGNVLIADTGNNRVRVIAAANGTFYGKTMTAGHIYTIAGPGPFSSVDGVTTDRHGNVIISDPAGAVWVAATTDGTFYGHAMTAGGIYQVAGGGSTLGDGGPATSALLANVGAVAVSPAGTLLVTDGTDNRLRAISP
jgi:NHL repeat